MQAKERLFLTADGTRLVAEGDPAGAVLYAAPGDEIPDSAVEKFGLVDGTIADAAPGGGDDGKRRHGGEDKSRKGGADKGATGSKEGGGDGADDLTRVKGIGAASAQALAAAGIDSFETLAAVNPVDPPQVAGLGARVDWDAWVKAAADIVMANASTGGLTINKRPKEG